MKHIFWLDKGRISGRSGPNKDTWDLLEIKRSGIKGILSVNNGEACNPNEFKKVGIEYRCVPLSENVPPRSGDMEKCLKNLPVALEFVNRLIEENKPVLVHCRSGKDRTGMFMAYYLVKIKGMEPLAAMEQVLSVRPIAFSAEGWKSFTREVLYKG